MRYYFILLISAFTLLALEPSAQAACRYEYSSDTNYDYTRTYYDGDGRFNYRFNPPLPESEPGTNCNVISDVSYLSNYRYYYDNNNQYTRTFAPTATFEASKPAAYTRTLVPQGSNRAVVETATYTRILVPQITASTITAPTVYKRTLVPQAALTTAIQPYVRTIVPATYQREPVYTYTRTYN